LIQGVDYLPQNPFQVRRQRHAILWRCSSQVTPLPIAALMHPQKAVNLRHRLFRIG
jgi:hypothetical protein